MFVSEVTSDFAPVVTDRRFQSTPAKPPTSILWATRYSGICQGVLPVSFFITAGVLFQGSPSVTLTESTGLVPQGDLDAEAAQIEDDASNYEYYPVVALGLTISF